MRRIKPTVFFVEGGTQCALVSDTVHDVFSSATVHDVSNPFLQIAEGAYYKAIYPISPLIQCAENPFNDLIESYLLHQPLEIERDDYFVRVSPVDEKETENPNTPFQEALRNNTEHQNDSTSSEPFHYQPPRILKPSPEPESDPIPRQKQRDSTQLESSPGPIVKGNVLAESDPIPQQKEKDSMKSEQRVKGNTLAKPAPEPDPEMKNPPLQSTKGNMLLKREPVEKTLDMNTLHISTPTHLKTTAKAVSVSLGSYNGVVTFEREAVVNDKGSITTPCFVTFNEDETIVGARAKYSLASHPSNTIPLCDVISLVGHSFNGAKVQAAVQTRPYVLVEKDDGKVSVHVETSGELKIFSLDEIVALVVKEFAKLALSRGPASHTVSTVPNDWDHQQQRILLKEALRLGLGQISLISEEVAVMMAIDHLHSHSAEGTNCLVVDIGARLLNVILLRKTDGTMHSVTTKCSAKLGGCEADEMLEQHFLSVFKQQHSKELPADVFPRLLLHCEFIKQRISAAGQDETVRAKIHNVVNDTDMELSMTHSLMDEICKGLFDGVVEKITQVLAEVGLEKGQINDLVIIGGGAKICGMKTAVQAFFEGKHLTAHLQ